MYKEVYLPISDPATGNTKIIKGIVTDTDDCWHCVSHAKTKNDYCIMHYNNKHTHVHRAVYQHIFGALPKYIHVRHKWCTTRDCFNPSHMKPGTAKENNEDIDIQGHRLRGEEIHSSKLKDTNVIEILNSLESAEELALRFSVSKTTIYNIFNNKSWKHIKRPEKLSRKKNWVPKDTLHIHNTRSKKKENLQNDERSPN